MFGFETVALSIFKLMVHQRNVEDDHGAVGMQIGTRRDDGGESVDSIIQAVAVITRIFLDYQE